MFFVYSYLLITMYVVFFFKQKTAYEMRISDWSSDVCSSDLRIGICRLEHVHHCRHALARVGAGKNAIEDLVLFRRQIAQVGNHPAAQDRKSTRLNSSH